jgi:hypothetical protein
VEAGVPVAPDAATRSAELEVAVPVATAEAEAEAEAVVQEARSSSPLTRSTSATR